MDRSHYTNVHRIMCSDDIIIVDLLVCISYTEEGQHYALFFVELRVEIEFPKTCVNSPQIFVIVILIQIWAVEVVLP